MRLKEIEERLAAIKNELTTRAAELKEEEITALENEVTALQEERAAIKAAAEKRSALLARIAAGESVGDGEGDGSGQQRVLRNFKGAAGEGDNDDKYGSMEYRKAFMKYVCRGEALPKEYRADAVSKSTDVGAVIPTTVLNQIVEKLESTGMILALVTRTAYKGGVSIPVSTVKPTARKRVQAMAADTTTLTEKMRAALRISSTSEKITEEINDCIAACKADMKNDGVKVIKETDGLIIRAITLYCKAEFGFNNAAEQFRKSYDALKMRLSLSAEYNTAPQVSETDTNSTESGV